MAVLPSSGPLSINSIASVMGGTAPHGLNEYYRGGGLVPSTKTGSVRTPSSGENYTYTGAPPNSYASYYFYTTAAGVTVWWNGVNVFNSFSGGGPFTQVTPSGSTITYYRGSAPGGAPADTYAVYSIDAAGTININTSVPTSGQISIGNFYGAEKGEIEGPIYAFNNYLWQTETEPNSLLIMWGGATIYEDNRADAQTLTSLVVGAYTYYRGGYAAGISTYSVSRSLNI